MSNMKSLSLIVAPISSNLNPKLRRRQNLIERLEEQQQLAKDPYYTVTARRWIKDTEGVKQLIEVKKRIKPWCVRIIQEASIWSLKAVLSGWFLIKG